jgi:alkanesulfonate monooxygenase SsuD/methylene tetrahydromethanopterin reductase-like flavin-dependent oxidoreductase (luciferase family)
MRFGYGLLTAQHHPSDPRSPAELYREAIEYGVLADRAGLDSVWTSEHHFVDDGYMSAQLPVLAAIGARTERIRLGTGVLLAPLFDPLRLAEDAATVDLISGGRLILGLGIGWRDEEFEGFELSPRSRAARLEGTIGVLRQAWGDGLVTGDGRSFRYPGPGLNVTPKPVHGAATPIWIGAGAEAAVRRAGRIADGYLGSGASATALADRAGWIRDEAEAAGRDPASIEIAVHRTAFAWRGGDAWARVADAARYMVWKYEDMAGARGATQRHLPDPGGSPAPEVVRSRMLVGSPDEVADGIRAYAGTLGASGSFVFRTHFPGLDPGVQREAFDVLVEEVLPLLRDAG